MADGTAIVRITAIPDAGLNRALSRVVTAARRASDASARAGKTAVAARQAETAAARQAFREQDSSMRRQATIARMRANQEAKALAATKAAAREEKQRARDAERITRDVARTRIREAERSARARMRAEQRAHREFKRLSREQQREAERAARRVSERRRAGLVAAGGAAVGIGRAGFELAGRAQRLAGVGTLEERIQDAAQFQQEMLLATGEARNADGSRLSAEQRKKIEADVLKASRDTNVSLLELATGLKSAQVNFDALLEFAQNIDQLAMVSAGKDIPVEDLINLLGAAKTGLGISSAEDQRRFLDLAIATAERGSIEAGLFARELGPFLAEYASQTDRTGMVAAAELMSTVQAMGKFQPGQAAQIQTQLRAFLFSLKEEDTEIALRKAGVEIYERELDSKGNQTGAFIKDDRGKRRLKGIADIARQAAESDRFAREVGTVGKGGLFGRKESVRAATFLHRIAYEDPEALANLQNIAPGEGLASAERNLAALKATPFFKVQSRGVEARARTFEDLDRLATAIDPMVGPLTELQSEFPLLTEATSSLVSVMTTMVGFLLADRLLRGGFANRGIGGGGVPRSLGNLAPVDAAASRARSSLVGLGGQADALGRKLGTITSVALPTFAAGLVGFKAGEMLKPMLAEMMGAPEASAEGFDKAIAQGAADVYDRMFGEIPRASGRGLAGGRGLVKIEVEDKRVNAKIVRSDEGLDMDVSTGMMSPNSLGGQ